MAIDKIAPERAVALRRELHAHPELSNQEVWTKRRLIDFLQEHTKLEIVDRGLWFYAVYRAGEGKPSIAFRADFDAVPVNEKMDIPWCSTVEGVSHKCGHDGHSAILAAFAVEIDRRGADKNIYFLFQHAEETGDGAKECAVFIPENEIEEIFCFHNAPGQPLGAVIVKDGVFQCASTGMSIYFAGAPAHASAPENGRNPALAIARIVCAIPGFIRPEEHRGIVLCTVVQVDIGEEAYGMSASEGVLRVTCRGELESEMNALIDKLKDMANTLSAEYGLECGVSFKDTFPETANHKDSVDKVRQVCKALGLDIIEVTEPKRGAEDFGHYTKATKGAVFNIGAGNVSPLHTSEYDFPDSIIEEVVDIFLGLAAL